MFFVLPRERQRNQGSLQAPPVSPASSVCFLKCCCPATGTVEHLCGKENEENLLPVLGRNALQPNKVEVAIRVFPSYSGSLGHLKQWDFFALLQWFPGVLKMGMGLTMEL